MRGQRAWIEIDDEALRVNVQRLQQCLGPQTQLMAVIKANAYGHGAIKVAQVVLAAGASWLAIATLAEGIELRQGGITAPILVLGVTRHPEEIVDLIRWQLQPTLVDMAQAIACSKVATQWGQTLSVHLKLDTGMSRLGTPWPQAATFAHQVQQLPRLHIASIYSHLATADDPDTSVMQRQKQYFDRALTAIQHQGITVPCRHLANSAATLRDATLHYDLVRIGLALYGVYPAKHFVSKLALKPVLQVKARITQVKTIPAGSGVSYGHRFTASQDLPLAVVGIGYADGVPRLLSNRCEVLVRGQRLQQIGTITMDQLMLDASPIPDLQVGEIATLIGQDGAQTITVDDWAETMGTISWEILCGFKHRLPRVGVG